MRKDTVIVDIDGVLADYRMGLLQWVHRNYEDYVNICEQHMKVTDTWINEEAMGVTYQEWLDVLEKFRMSGGKQFLPVNEGAGLLLNLFKQKELFIVLLTSRPIDIYHTIYRDTIVWLRENSLPYNLLLWSKDKAEMCYKMGLTKDRVLFAIDDELKHVENYSKLGIRTYWLDACKKANLSNTPSRCFVIDSLQEVFDMENPEVKNEQSESNVT